MNQLNRALLWLALGALLTACGADEDDHGHSHDGDADRAHAEGANDDNGDHGHPHDDDRYAHESAQTEVFYGDEAAGPAGATGNEAGGDGHAHGDDTHTHGEDEAERTGAGQESDEAHGHDH